MAFSGFWFPLLSRYSFQIYYFHKYSLCRFGKTIRVLECRINGQILVESDYSYGGRQGSRRPLAWASRPLHLSRSPLSPPAGEFPPATPSGGRQAARQGIPLLQPCHAACIFPSALRQGRRRPFPLPQGSAPPLLILARYFIPRPHALCATCSAGSTRTFH